MTSEKTPWFSPKVLPVRKGFYEVRDIVKYKQLNALKRSLASALHKVYFDGTEWKAWKSSGYNYTIHALNHEWRGFTTNQDEVQEIEPIVLAEHFVMEDSV